MTEFPACLLIVTVEVDAAVESEWNRWYDTVHLPDALKCPGVRSGRRYVSSGEISETDAGKMERTAKRIYTTIYELDSAAATATPEFHAMRGWYHFAPHVRSRTQREAAIPVGARPPTLRRPHPRRDNRAPGGPPETMDLELRGRTAWVTGCRVGIGREIARVLASEGMPTRVVARRGALLKTPPDRAPRTGAR